MFSMRANATKAIAEGFTSMQADLDRERKVITKQWAKREEQIERVMQAVKRILRKYGYPPDKQEKATLTVLEQAEVLSKGWALVA